MFFKEEVLFIFDKNKNKKFKCVEKCLILYEIKVFYFYCSGVFVVLVGNKCDLVIERYVIFSKEKYMYVSIGLYLYL